MLFIFIADVFGTLEALTNIINKYSDTRCPLDVVDATVGSVTEDDIEAAELFNGIFAHMKKLQFDHEVFLNF